MEKTCENCMCGNCNTLLSQICGCIGGGLCRSSVCKNCVNKDQWQDLNDKVCDEYSEECEK